MLTAILPLRLFVLLAILSCGCAGPCPITSHPGNIFSGISSLTQTKSSQLSMEESFPSTMARILNVIIIHCHIHFEIFQTWPYQFTILKANLPGQSSFSLNLWGLNPLALSPLWFALNGHTLNGYILVLVSWRMIAKILRSAITKLIQGLYRVVMLGNRSRFYSHLKAHLSQEPPSITISSFTGLK